MILMMHQERCKHIQAANRAQNSRLIEHAVEPWYAHHC